MVTDENVEVANLLPAAQIRFSANSNYSSKKEVALQNRQPLD
jgi:hypothetical protein